jgi:hypothetical protein
MRATAHVGKLAGREALKRQALGFAVLVLAVSGGYAVSHLGVEDLLATVQMLESGDEAVESVAEEPPPTKVEIDGHIEDVATQYGVAPKLVAAIVSVESQFNPRAVSRRGAEGLMQLMPQTAAYLDVDDPFDPRANIDGGVRHLKRLMRRFHNNLPLVLAAYNAGEQAVINHRGIPPYRETRQYVVRVLRRYDREQAKIVAQQLARGKKKPTVTASRVARVMSVAPAAPAAAAVGARAASAPVVTQAAATTATPLVPELADFVAPAPSPAPPPPALRRGHGDSP